MPISFIHAADIHLDSPLKGLERYENAPVDRIRGATRRAFTRLVDLAINRRVDFVLISGDLYDGDWRDYNTGLFLVREVGRLRDLNIPVIMIAGNHDAANKMTRALRLPPNTHLLTHDHPETVILEDLGVAIHGQSFAKPAITANLATAYPKAIGGYSNIGLLHTAMGGVEGHERYAPCTIDDLRARGYDYWALGHVHARQVVCPDPLAVFAGNIQGRHIRETGPKGCIIATVGSDQGIEWEFERLDQVRWERAQIDVSGIDSESDCLDRIAEAFDGLLASEPEPDTMLAVRLVLSGSTALHGRIHADTERMVAELRSLANERGNDRLWLEKVELETRPHGSDNVSEGPFHELVEVIAQFQSNPETMAQVFTELSELKRKLPAELANDPDGPHLDDGPWVQSLLEQIQPVLLDLLTHSDDVDAN